MGKKFLIILKFLILLLFSSITICLLYNIYNLNLLKPIFLTILTIILLLINIFIVIKSISNKSKLVTKIIISILSIILGITYAFGIIYSDKFIQFIVNITKEQYEIKKYSVLSLKTSSYNTLEDLKNDKIGYITTILDSNNAKKNINIELKEYENVGSLVLSIYNDETKAIILDNSLIELLSENNVNFINESKVIYTFEIKYKKSQTKKAVDVNETPFIVYISGSDSREGVSAVARSDVNILAVVNPKNNKILLVSVPRDYYVQLHGTTGLMDKLTHAGLYGLNMSKQTMEDLFDISINYSFKVSFNALVNVVDVIDGIDINSDKSFRSFTNRNCYFEKGIQHVNGTCALAYARERMTYSTGDYHRSQNQQEVLSSIIKRISNSNYLLKYSELLDALDGNMETDLTYEDITSFVKNQLTEFNNWQIYSVIPDGINDMRETYSIPNEKKYVSLQNKESINNIKNIINDYLK